MAVIPGPAPRRFALVQHLVRSGLVLTEARLAALAEEVAEIKQAIDTAEYKRDFRPLAAFMSPANRARVLEPGEEGK